MELRWPQQQSVLRFGCYDAPENNLCFSAEKTNFLASAE